MEFTFETPLLIGPPLRVFSEIQIEIPPLLFGTAEYWNVQWSLCLAQDDSCVLPLHTQLPPIALALLCKLFILHRWGISEAWKCWFICVNTTINGTYQNKSYQYKSFITSYQSNRNKYFMLWCHLLVNFVFYSKTDQRRLLLVSKCNVRSSISCIGISGGMKQG